MNKSEIQAVRNLLAISGWEHTPNQIKENFGEQLDLIKEGFLEIKQHITDLATKFNDQEISIEEVAETLATRLEKKVSADYAKHLLLMNSIFENTP